MHSAFTVITTHDTGQGEISSLFVCRWGLNLNTHNHQQNTFHLPTTYTARTGYIWLTAKRLVVSYSNRDILSDFFSTILRDFLSTPIRLEYQELLQRCACYRNFGRGRKIERISYSHIQQRPWKHTFSLAPPPFLGFSKLHRMYAYACKQSS